MWIGQAPRVVRLPILHLQVISPFEPAFLGSNPRADDGPDAYSTSMPHVAPVAVLIVTEAVPPRATLAVCVETRTASSLCRGGTVGLLVAVGPVVGCGTGGDAVADCGVSLVDGAVVVGGVVTGPIRPKTAGATLGADDDPAPPIHEPARLAMTATPASARSHR